MGSSLGSFICSFFLGVQGDEFTGSFLAAKQPKTE
uniref:Uncharacterized protein MANES_01G177900 n=1 Tax=Rhizophora mucronata TaxID=61149 RepID=A0A2P2J727_RHIMU